MNHLGKFYALSAVYLGLASAVSAQPIQNSSPQRSSESAQDARPDTIEHPMLERQPTHEMRPEDDGQRIQRRGLHDARQDGQIQRNPLPGAADTTRPSGITGTPGASRSQESLGQTGTSSLAPR